MKKIPALLAAVLIGAGCTAAGAAVPETGERLRRTDLEHFTLWSQRELLTQDLDAVRRHLQNVRREVGREFGNFFPQQKFDVMLVEEAVFRSYSGSPGHVSGLFDGTIHLPVAAGGADPARLQAVLHHEYTHALLWRASGGKCPAWIHEGFAVEQEERVSPRRTPDPAQLVTGDRLLWPLDKLEAHMNARTGDPQDTGLAYQEAHAVIRFLRSRYRPGQILQWIRRMEQQDWEAAAREVLRMNAGQMERGTARFLAASQPGY